MPLNYANEFQAAYRRNREGVMKDVMSGKLDKKINNFCELHGFERDDVIREIKDNPMVAALFAINPNKQNIYENEAADFIEKIQGVTNFKKLPTNALSVVGGAVMSKRELKRQGGVSEAKTIDFMWVYGDYQFYASHKYTKDEGGAQGNQYKDLKSFINAARPTTAEKTYFIAIADGAFYDGQNGEAGKTRIDRLKELGSTKVFACKIDDLEILMKEKTRP